MEGIFEWVANQLQKTRKNSKKQKLSFQSQKRQISLIHWGDTAPGSPASENSSNKNRETTAGGTGESPRKY